MVEINAVHGYTRITDNKMGWQRFGMGELLERADGTMSRLGTQLRLYSALYMMCNPDVHEVSVRGVAPRFFSQDDHAWTRETAVPWAQQRITRAYARLDDLRERYGDKDWPCEACANCQYCSLACPDSVFDIYEECA
jgi:ferredoxin